MIDLTAAGGRKRGELRPWPEALQLSGDGEDQVLAAGRGHDLDADRRAADGGRNGDRRGSG